DAGQRRDRGSAWAGKRHRVVAGNGRGAQVQSVALQRDDQAVDRSDRVVIGVHQERLRLDVDHLRQHVDVEGVGAGASVRRLAADSDHQDSAARFHQTDTRTACQYDGAGAVAHFQLQAGLRLKLELARNVNDLRARV